MVRKRFPTLKLAEQALARAQVAALDGTYVFRGDAKMTIAEYAPTWLASLRVEHSTLAGYQTYLKCQVLPQLGSRAMSSLRRSDINAFVGTLVGKGLAPRTVRHIYALLAMMLRSAVYDRLLTSTPATRSTSRRSCRRSCRSSRPSRSTPCCARHGPTTTRSSPSASATGMRQGELLGVRPRAVNFATDSGMKGGEKANKSVIDAINVIKDKHSDPEVRRAARQLVSAMNSKGGVHSRGFINFVRSEKLAKLSKGLIVLDFALNVAKYSQETDSVIEIGVRSGLATGGTVAGGWAAGLAAAPVCTGIGIGTAGIGGFLCEGTVIFGGAYAGGKIGEWAGAKLFEGEFSDFVAITPPQVCTDPVPGQSMYPVCGMLGYDMSTNQPPAPSPQPSKMPPQ
jgi:hypothetical protein